MTSFVIAHNAMDLLNDSWRQAEAWLLFMVGAAEVNLLPTESYRGSGGDYFSDRMSAAQLDGRVFKPRSLSDLP